MVQKRHGCDEGVGDEARTDPIPTLDLTPCKRQRWERCNQPVAPNAQVHAIGNITSSDLWLVAIGALAGYIVPLAFNFWGRRIKLGRVRKLERLEDKLERFTALERDVNHAHLILTRKVANIVRFSAYMFFVVLAIQFFASGQAETLVIGSSAGILLGASRELKECAEFARALQTPEAYRYELEKEIKRKERRLSI